MSSCQDFNNSIQENQINIVSNYGFGPTSTIYFPFNGWKKSTVQMDSSGYFKLYESIRYPRFEKVLMIYGKDNHTSLRDSMQESINVNAHLSCDTQQNKIISESQKVISFSTQLRGCKGANVSALIIIVKIFSEPDGQYSIIYSADPTIVSPNRIEEIKKQTLSAHLTKIN